MIDFLYTIKNNVITYLKKTLGTHTRNKTIFFHKNKFLSITLFACQILLLVPSLSATIDLSYYAGSYHYCPKEKKVLSPLNGVIYYHRLIRGLYPEKNALAKFCQKLFYCVHGNGQQLYPTKDRNKTVTHLSPEVIAQLITTMEHFRITKEQEPEKIKTQLFLLINNNQAYQDSLIQTVDLYKKDREDALIKNFEENNNKELSSFVTSFINACFATGLLQENVSIKKSNKKRTVIALPYTPYYLLQAFVYRKYTTKDELLNFCNGLGINIPEKISKPQGEDEIRFYSILSHNDLPVIDDSLEVNFLLGKDERFK